MATSSISRIPKRKDDGSIETERLIRDSDGSLRKVSEIIFTSESPTLSVNFTDEINQLIASGQIVIPNSAQAGAHIVDISDQLASGKKSYNFVNSTGDGVECGDIYRVFFNGLNVSEDVEISGDRLAFTFIDEYDNDDFSHPNTRLVIDFLEKIGDE